MEISVICPVFNTAPALLNAAVESVLNQHGNHTVELILVDDGSTNEATFEALRLLASDPRVHVTAQRRNGGPAAARMAGVAIAQFGWLGFIDSDDLWPTNKLDLTQQAVNRDPTADWVCGRYATVYRDCEKLEQSLMESALPNDDRNALTRRLITGMPPLGASTIRRSLFLRAGGLDLRLIYGEDWLLYLRLSTMATPVYVDQPVYRLRRQYSSMMWSFGRMSSQYAAASRLARRDPNLSAVHRDIRWYLYANYKSIAMNNKLNRRPIRALAYAIRALALDPREIKEFALFCRAAALPRDRASHILSRYSTSEQVLLDQVSR